MRQSIGWGAAIGAVAAVVTLLGQSRERGVSLFPDLLSFIVFATLAAFALDRLLRHADGWRAVMGVTTAFGSAAGLVLGLATLLRGAMVWTRVTPLFAAIGVAGSIVFVLLVSYAIGFLTSTRLRRDRVRI